MALTKVTQHVLKDGIVSSSHLASGFTLSASHVSSLDTDNISEGSSNLYFTNERVDDRVNALLTAGTGITLTYDDANNTLTVTGSASYGDSDVASYLSTNGYDTAANIKADLVDSAPSTLNTLNELAAALGDDANYASSTSTALGLRVERTSATGSAKIPVGTTGQRDGSPSNGFFRYNTTTAQFEGYSAGSWGEIGGGTTDTFTTDQFDATTSGVGVVDGSNAAFTLSKTPSSEDKIMVFIDGVYQQQGDYTLSGTTLTLDTAPASGEVVTVHMVTATVLDATGLVVDSFTATSGQTVFVLSTNPKLEANTQVFKQGVYLDKSLYSVSGNTLTLASGATTGDKVDVLILSAAQLGTASLVTDSFTGNGSTSAYTLSDSPNSVMVFLDGAFQAPSTYTLSGASLTFGANVPSGVVITVYHVSGSDFSGVNSGLNSFTGNGSTTAYTLTQNPGHENNTMVYLNGVYQEKDTYSVSGKTLTFATAPASGESIEVMYFKSTTVVQPGSNTVGVSELNLSEGSDGQVLTTNGAGTISFQTPSSYGDSDVETYLDGGTATPIFPSAAISASDPVINIARSSNYSYKIGSLANDTFVIQSNESSDASFKPLIEIDSYAHGESVFLKGDANGRLGVGQATPTEKLDVNGNIKGNNYYVADDITHTGDADTYISFENDFYAMYAGGNRALDITSSYVIPKMNFHYANNNIYAVSTTNDELGNGQGVMMLKQQISVTAGSKIIVWYDSGQILNNNQGGNGSANSNPQIAIYVTTNSSAPPNRGVDYMINNNTDHYMYPNGSIGAARIKMNGMGATDTLTTGGTYYIYVYGGAYNSGSYSFNYQDASTNTRGSSIIWAEIKA